VTQHAGLTLERWQRFDRDRQVLMIANEMHRGSQQTAPEARERCYERVLRLTDLTVQAGHRPAFQRELLRWRDGVAELYLGARAAAAGDRAGASVGDEAANARHLALLRCLLLLAVEAARQRPFVLP
jgi:hypothetical protein